MDWKSIKGVSELRTAQTYFLELLLTTFRVDRNNDIIHLNVQFSNQTNTVTSREHVVKIRKIIPDFEKQVKKYKKQFDELLKPGKNEEINYEDPTFPFRYASGGTLPIVIMGEKEYYCLFYRDVFPVGWNIANGGCDSLTELLDPSITVTRELAEELIIVSHHKKVEYIYKDDDGRIVNRPEFEMAREQWNNLFVRCDLQMYKQLPADIEWIDGPDQLTATLLTDNNNQRVIHVTDKYFVNITPPDFSIEIDKVAKITVDARVLFLDGEISDNKIRCRPIGLFEVEKTDKKVSKGEKIYLPDKLYYLGSLVVGDDEYLKEVILDDNIYRLIRSKTRKKDHLKDVKTMDYPFDLCPITRQMIKRYINHRKSQVRCNVFLSYSTLDREFIEKLYKDFSNVGINCYRAPESMKTGQILTTELMDQIDSADIYLIVISENSLESAWVNMEANEAIRIEAKNSKQYIIPVQIDDSIFTSKEGWAKILLQRHIGDFRNWENANSYKVAFNQLLQLLLHICT